MTDYEKLTLTGLWAWVGREHDEDGFTHVRTLYRQQMALEQQRDNLQRMRDQLVRGWPPERSGAAATFIARIDEMIGAMDLTARAVGRTLGGIDQTYATIRDLRRRLNELKDYGTSDRQTADERARQIMRDADAEIRIASGNLSSSVPTYKKMEQPGADISQPASLSSDTGSQTVGGGRLSELQESIDQRTSRGMGEVLQTTDVALTGGVLDQKTIQREPDPVKLSAGIFDGANSGPSRIGVAPDLPGMVIRAPRSTSNVSAARPTDVPGQSVGIVPGVGGEMRPSGTLPGRSRGALGETGSTGTPGPVSGGYRDRSYQEYAERRRRTRDSGNEVWPVKEGVPPVIEPAPERPHDPGPGVLGIDR
ncbi:hypothetical protein [Dactylosporangium matsuzakiense]|uniref:Uncharacterized protein n=1 Tax=Dactylosporangium matsuzakiense TaxID=53360 RepID=A0A9W6KFT1_9ACTN|nr:hypothetical protein [Dactylosporangium matsuzakiense]UWZ46581.1 hypothetical protein Dmats_09235 [Dactylosporangium matsuzakiense]GLL01291.1 hypothetical protein GCM10017581_030320 [Dactylosporangium matsuzakiense]